MNATIICHLTCPSNALSRNMVKETWKGVVGYEGYYEVSNLGRVKRIRKSSNLINPLTTYVGKILKPWLSQGYKEVSLFCKNKRRTIRVHRMVAMAFLGLPKDGQEVNHKNGIRADSRMENLEWVTHGENQLHASQVLGRWQGERNSQAKLKKKDVIKIRQLLMQKKFSQIQIAKKFRVSQQLISCINLRERWVHLQAGGDW